MYDKHSKIPVKFRKIILEETGEFRLKDVSLPVCNEIIQETIEFEKTSFEKYSKFQIEALKGGKRIIRSATSLKDAECIMDEIIEYGEQKNVIMVLRQGERLIRAYLKGEVIYPSDYETVYGIPPKKYA